MTKNESAFFWSSGISNLLISFEVFKSKMKTEGFWNFFVWPSKSDKPLSTIHNLSHSSTGMTKKIFFLLSQDWFRMWWKMRKKVLWWNMWDIVADGIYPIYFYIIHIGWLYPLLSKIVGMNLINFQLIWRILDGFLAKTLMI